MKFPDSNEALGFGRGLLMGDMVIWPTREHLYVFQQRQNTAGNFGYADHAAAGNPPCRLRQPIHRWKSRGGREYILLATVTDSGLLDRKHKSTTIQGKQCSLTTTCKPCSG